VIKSFVKIGVGIGHTATEGTFLRRVHENGGASAMAGAEMRAEKSLSLARKKGRYWPVFIKPD
jgi:hypothetical protein